MCSKSLFHFKKSKCINLFGLGYVQLLTKLSLRCTKMNKFLTLFFETSLSLSLLTLSKKNLSARSSKCWFVPLVDKIIECHHGHTTHRAIPSSLFAKKSNIHRRYISASLRLHWRVSWKGHGGFALPSPCSCQNSNKYDVRWGKVKVSSSRSSLI